MTKAVLVVDDSPDFLDLMEVLLGREGYTVLKAETAARGLELMAADVPSAVLLDIMMPDRSGMDMLENIRWEPRYGDLPVICMSAVYLNGRTRRFIDEFSLGLFSKSDLDHLVAEVKQLVGPP